MEIDYNAVVLAISTFKNILGSLRDAKELLPEGEDKKKIEVKIEEADRARKEAEIKLAGAWGYPVCRRTFPPAIMLKVGDDPETGGEKFRCPECGDGYPRPFPSLEYRSPLLDR